MQALTVLIPNKMGCVALKASRSRVAGDVAKEGGSDRLRNKYLRGRSE